MSRKTGVLYVESDQGRGMGGPPKYQSGGSDRKWQSSRRPINLGATTAKEPSTGKLVWPSGDQVGGAGEQNPEFRFHL